ncbi:MAG: phosphoenolpyruvate synthase [Gammaproteobacteria bacterium]|nr:phosphoenolpyruvate synthase [Gammaproteobacteria bacterium]MBU0786461.1 phosphoenolpyruvate synthase [Gammaproteobacteria bacterium]MBU0816164.1 phosphoenolpyruvate synthase [Gammaproteobacteria bacterium]MBU1787810.1 phosphoenolpyruvate synthase [Gammaproteobacteria bacterium]
MTKSKPKAQAKTQPLVRWFSDLRRADTAIVGGKNSSLGEMISKLRVSGINVPGGFATTAHAYWEFLEANDLKARMSAKLKELDKTGKNLAKVGKAVRKMILEADMPAPLAEVITRSYREMAEHTGHKVSSVAVRSSATAEDLPEASFAGQLETFLNISGDKALLQACKKCYASLFTDRAIVYRNNHGFDHMQVALSIGVQAMVRSDKAGSGVMFSIDTESGFPRSVLINSAWGLGETVVQGMVEPDEYQVFKPLLNKASLIPIVEKTLGGKAQKMIYAKGSNATSRLVKTSKQERASFVLSDDEVLQLARWATMIEAHYGQPMDMEWAKDGESGELFIVQARPETVQSRREAGTLKTYSLKQKGSRLVTGLAVGDSISSGKVCRLGSPAEIDQFVDGAILVTRMTDPDWVPIMKKASAIVTDHGGRTSHAAIVSRELGLTAIVGAGNATQLLKNGMDVTVSCAEGDAGHVYEGILDFEVRDIDLDDIPKTNTRIMVNLGNPSAAFRWWRLPSDGVGLARMEFIISNLIKIHPMALVHYESLKDKKARRAIDELTAAYEDKTQYFVDTLAHGMARIAAAHYPKPVIVRMSDFKTNEYAQLIGGAAFEPKEENPMLGWRGASRYYSEGYREGFALECRAVRQAREVIGLTNIIIMIPFCRTLGEADKVLDELAANGLKRGKKGLEVYVMAEIPANVLLAEKFAERFDGFSIGSNDLTQLTLGVDRDSGRLSELFNEQDEAVTSSISQLLAKAQKSGRHTGICGQAPSDHPEFARFLVAHGIDSISVSPDSFLAVKQVVSQTEKELRKPAARKKPKPKAARKKA